MGIGLRTRLEFALLLVLFVLSGAAGLIYESIWARYLGLLVGHTAYAQVIVLATFLGGMSLGAFLAGERAPQLREPLLAYAAVEVLIGLFGIAFHPFFLVVEALAESTLFPWVGAGGSSLVARVALATALILPPSVLLGSTFPLMTCGALRRIGSAEAGRVLSLLYFANTIGAAIAVLAAGFVLIEIAGLPGTITLAGILNLGVALGAWMLARSGSGAAARVENTESEGEISAAAAAAVSPTVRWLLLVVAFGTAVGSFAYEIAWIRMLSLVLGSASHSFELMLSAFILGLALGSFWIRRRADQLESPLGVLGRAQWAMGLAAIGTVVLYVWSFDWVIWLLRALAPSPAGYTAFNVSRYGIAVLFMLPATFCAGIVLPLLTSVLVGSTHGEKAIGRVYSLNTFGSIVGVMLAALVLLPVVGFGRLLVLGAVVDVFLGVLLLLAARRRGEAVLVSSGAIVLAVTVMVFFVGQEHGAVASGVFRGGQARNPAETDVLFYRDGRTATVTVTHDKKSDVLLIATNGKADASLRRDWAKPSKGIRRPVNGDEAAQLLLAMVTLAHRPLAETGAVVGQGSGMSSHLLLSSERMKRLVTVEIEPEMISGSREFLPANRRVFEDPRSKIVIDDAKSYFAATGTVFDLILSEPSNPWVSGVSSLFTTEFYERIRKSLAPGGVFGQWLQVYDIHDGLVLSVLAAIHRVFPDYRLYLLNGGDLLIVASGETVQAPDWSVVRRLESAGDTVHLYPLLPGHLDALRIADRSSLSSFLDDWDQPNSDFFPILDLGAERSRFLRERADGLLGLGSDRFTPLPQQGGSLSFGPPFELSIRDQPRLQRLWLASHLHAPKAESDEPQIAEAAYRIWRWRTASSFDLSPSDWQRWVLETYTIEAFLHGGSGSIVDEDFYATLRDTVRLANAPEPARASVGFLESAARGDLRSAAVHLPLLFDLAVNGEVWVPLDTLYTMGIRAALEAGDAPLAQRVYVTLTGKLGRTPNDLRSRLLDAKIRGALPPGKPPA